MHQNAFTAEHISCEIDPILESLLEKDPNEEAIHQHTQGRDIYLGTSGFSLEVPGIIADPYCLLDTGKLAVIPGTTDAFCSREHKRLNDIARAFTKIYNEKITELTNGTIIGSCGA